MTIENLTSLILLPILFVLLEENMLFYIFVQVQRFLFFELFTHVILGESY